MGGNETRKDSCTQRISRALDLACSSNAEIWAAMPGHVQGRMILEERLKKAPPSTVQRLCASLVASDGSDPKRDALAAYAVVEGLDTGTPVEMRTVVDRFGALPTSEVRFRLAQRVQQLVGPAPNPAVPDLALADPLLVGASISGGDPKSTGSITCFVTDIETGKPMLLTCYHALRPTTAFVDRQEKKPFESMDDMVFQPAQARSGGPIGTFVRGIRSKGLDAAVATMDHRKFSNRTREGVNVRGIATLVRDSDPVWKRGAGTRVQRGIIRGGLGFASERNTYKQFENQLSAIFSTGEPLYRQIHSQEDDGCPIFDARNNLVGMVIGLTDGPYPDLIVTPIGRVLDELGVQLAT